MKIRTALIALGLLMSFAGTAVAAGLVGKWTCEFDSQIGVQKYTFEFNESGDRIVGFATFERSFGNGRTELKEIKQDGEKVSFVEPFSFEGNEVPIRYTGSISDDEMKLRRDVGDFATEHIVAKRVATTAE
jgi:hypothetical protein